MTYSMISKPFLQSQQSFNTLRPRQHGPHFADDSFKRIFLNENIGISIKISLKFVHKGPMNNIPALVQIMAWRGPGDKPLSEPMVGSLLMHICFTQWVKEDIDGILPKGPYPPCFWQDTLDIPSTFQVQLIKKVIEILIFQLVPATQHMHMAINSLLPGDSCIMASVDMTIICSAPSHYLNRC